MFGLLQTLVGFQLGYVFCYTNQISPALNAKFGWTTKQEQDLYESIIGSSVTLTLMLGSYIAGHLIKKGRRNVLIYAGVIGILGAAITIYQQFWSIILGRLIYGLSCGFIAISMPRTMEETIPNKWVGMFGGLYCLSFALATMIAYFMAYFLPPDSDTVALAESPVTQVIFGLPIVFYSLQLLLQFTYFRMDPPKFLINID